MGGKSSKSKNVSDESKSTRVSIVSPPQVPTPTPPPPPPPPPPRSHYSFDLPQLFKLSDIKLATDDFSEENVLGQGGFGKVYKGYFPLENGQNLKVAVKRLDPESRQGQEEWLAEILTLGKVSHPNLVKFYGYCSEEGEGILVYEYVPLGSLDYHLFSSSQSEDDRLPSLPFEVRLKIAHGTASGLAYLHENNIIHRDFKAPNVLLNAQYDPIITDFGLAKTIAADETHISTRILGALGYLDPNYMKKGQLTKKSDVYSFGVMLLELISGRRAMTNNQSITSWAASFIHEKKPQVEKIVDPSILSSVSSKSMERIAQKLIVMARHCVEEEPQSRPEMPEIVDILLTLVNFANN